MSDASDASADAISKTTDAAEAVEKARQAQMAEMKAEQHIALVSALKEVLTSDDTNAPMLIKRVPFICSDIRDIKSDLRWMKWIGSGFVGAAGLLALHSLGL